MRWHIGLACATVLGLAACGGSGGTTRIVTHTVTAATSASSSSHSANATTAPASTSATTATTSVAAGGSQPCTARDLELSYLGSNGATGHVELGFALKNITSAPCHTFGYPGIQFLDRHGGDLTTIPHHTTSDFFGHTSEVELTIAPGDSASFRLGVTTGAIPGSVCATAHGLQVIPPDDTASIRTTISDGTYECQDATVSPLQPGDSAFG